MSRITSDHDARARRSVNGTFTGRGFDEIRTGFNGDFRGFTLISASFRLPSLMITFSNTFAAAQASLQAFTSQTHLPATGDQRAVMGIPRPLRQRSKDQASTGFPPVSMSSLPCGS